jgi:hypothetical protein
MEAVSFLGKARKKLSGKGSQKAFWKKLAIGFLEKGQQKQNHF